MCETTPRKSSQSQRNLGQQLKVARQQSQLLMMELAQSRQHEQQLKRLNKILVDNLGTETDKQPAQALKEIKLIIEGGTLYDEKIIEMQEEIQRLNSKMSEQVENRVKGLQKDMEVKYAAQSLCPSCLQLEQRTHDMMTIEISLRTELQSVKRNLAESNKSSRRVTKDEQSQNEQRKAMRQLRQENESLHEELDVLRQQLHHRQEDLKVQEEEWCKQLQESESQHEDELESLRSQFDGTRRDSSYREPHQLKQLHNLVSEMYSHKPKQTLKSSSRISKASSRQNNDFASFTIKDAINRPTKGLTFY